MDEQSGASGYEAPLDGIPGQIPDHNPPLTVRERRTAAAIAVGCVVLAGLAGVPMTVSTGEGRGAALWSGLVYGALLASAAVVVYVDRLFARQCPRCGDRHHDRGVVTCLRCGYDLVVRPRYACPESHAVYLEPGLCDCGVGLRRVAPAMMFGELVGAGRRVGNWPFAVLLCIGILLHLTGM